MNFLNARFINFSLFLVILIWNIGILWELIVFYLPSSFYLLPFLKYNYSIVCHVQPEKLFEYAGLHTLVCSRCAGIYFGAFISSFIILIGFKKITSSKLLLLSSLPIFIDIILYSINIYSYSKYIALLTGLLLGSIGFFYIHSSFIDLLTKRKGEN